MKGSGTREVMYVLRQMGERIMQHQKDLCTVSIDYTKAYDRLNHSKLLEIMKKIVIPFHKTYC